MRLHAPAEALHRAATRIAAVTEAVALNAPLLTQDGLDAIACRDESVAAPPGGDAASWVLKYRIDAESVVVASSGWDQSAPDWQILANHRVLTVSRRTLRTTLQDWPAQLDLLPAS
jgi:hypothetical protein